MRFVSLERCKKLKTHPNHCIYANIMIRMLKSWPLKRFQSWRKALSLYVLNITVNFRTLRSGISSALESCYDRLVATKKDTSFNCIKWNPQGKPPDCKAIAALIKSCRLPIDYCHIAIRRRLGKCDLEDAYFNYWLRSALVDLVITMKLK